MSLTSISSLAPTALGHRRPRGALSLLGRLLRRLKAWEDQHHLRGLSDHMLKDMGFLRDQIDDVLRAPSAARKSGSGSSQADPKANSGGRDDCRSPCTHPHDGPSGRREAFLSPHA